MINIIRESDLFQIIMMNTLEREIKRSFADNQEPPPNRKKRKVTNVMKAKLKKDVNDGFTKINKKNIDSYKDKISNLEVTVQKLNEENRKIKEQHEEEFKKNQQKWEKEMKMKEQELEQQSREKINEYVRKQKI